MKKTAIFLVIALCAFSLYNPAPAYAGNSALKPGASSLLIPGWGQYQNGEFDTKGGRIKSWTMILVEVGAIVTTAVVGGTVGAPVVWVGIGLLIANHVWSSFDAFLNAPTEPGVAMSAQAA